MIQIIIGTFIISIFHALIPSHWLPILALSKTLNWSPKETLRYTFILGLCHVAGTLILGLLIFFIGNSLTNLTEYFASFIGPILLIIIGIYFIYQHHHHHHFHIDEKLINPVNNVRQLLMALMFYMLVSPCAEVIPFFLTAASHGIYLVIGISLIYMSISIIGMLIWMRFAINGIARLNWHSLEHNAGLITGITISLVGILSFFIH